jgi:hypothetical protein
MTPSILLWCPHCENDLAITEEGPGRCEWCGRWYDVEFDGDADAEGVIKDASRIRALDGPNGTDEAGDERFHRDR